jgi:hypothetical protein
MNIICHLLLLVILVSCQSQNSENLLSNAKNSLNSGNQIGSLRLLATDAPFDFQSVLSAQVTINEVKLRSESGKSFLILNKPTSIELLDLKNGLLTTLNEINIPEGRYNQISLIVNEAFIQLKDGRSFPLKLPSGAQSGLKIFLSLGLDIDRGQTTDLLLDFDLSRSFVPQGKPDNIKGFIFKPVIRGACLAKTGSFSGKIISKGTLDNSSDDSFVSGGVVTLMKNGEIVATAVSEFDGFFKIIGLSPGIYTAAVMAIGLASLEVSNIEILVAEDTEYDFILSPELIDYHAL